LQVLRSPVQFRSGPFFYILNHSSIELRFASDYLQYEDQLITNKESAFSDRHIIIMKLCDDDNQTYLINTDKLFKVELRGYDRLGDVVVYNFVLIDLINSLVYENWYRYNELKSFHIILEQLEVMT
jgi:hypothetical protein